MKNKTESEQLNLVDMSDKELKEYKNKIIMQRSILYNDCAEEMAQFMKDENYDPYSFWGERKMKKVADKYADLLNGADTVEEMVDRELEKREQYNEEMRYSGRSILKRRESEENVEEFLEREQEKTMAIKAKNDIN